MRRWSLAALAVASLLSACGGSKPSSHTTTAGHHASARATQTTLCLPRAKALMASRLAVDPSAITTATSIGTNGNPQCTFTIHAGHHKRVAIVANEYTGPQPYFILSRTEEEAQQVFTPQRLSPAPQNVPGLGLAAAWFPATNLLMATDAIRLIDITLKWPGASQAQQRTLGIALARPYLRLTKKSAQLAKAYP